MMSKSSREGLARDHIERGPLAALLYYCSPYEHQNLMYVVVSLGDALHVGSEF